MGKDSTWARIWVLIRAMIKARCDINALTFVF
jgi:hypothetical protein